MRYHYPHAPATAENPPEFSGKHPGERGAASTTPPSTDQTSPRPPGLRPHSRGQEFQDRTETESWRLCPEPPLRCQAWPMLLISSRGFSRMGKGVKEMRSCPLGPEGDPLGTPAGPAETWLPHLSPGWQATLRGHGHREPFVKGQTERLGKHPGGGGWRPSYHTRGGCPSTPQGRGRGRPKRPQEDTGWPAWPVRERSAPVTV